MVILLVSISTAVFAQKGGPRSGYNFTTVVDLKTTPVKNNKAWEPAGTTQLSHS